MKHKKSSYVLRAFMRENKSATIAEFLNVAYLVCNAKEFGALAELSNMTFGQLQAEVNNLRHEGKAEVAAIKATGKPGGFNKKLAKASVLLKATEKVAYDYYGIVREGGSVELKSSTTKLSDLM